MASPFALPFASPLTYPLTAALGSEPGQSRRLLAFGDRINLAGSSSTVTNCNWTANQFKMKRVAPRKGNGLVFSFPGWFSDTDGEHDQVYDFTIKMSVEYNGVLYPMYFSGQRTATIAQGSDVFSDPLYIPGGIAAGDTYWLRGYRTVVGLRAPVATITITGTGSAISAAVTDGGQGLNPTVTGVVALVPLSATATGLGTCTLTPVVAAGVCTGITCTTGTGATNGTRAVTFAGGCKWLGAAGQINTLGEFNDLDANLPDLSDSLTNPSNVNIGNYLGFPLGVYAMEAA